MALEDEILSGITSSQSDELSERAKEYLSVLNPEQHEAVVHEGSPLLILAGAGSGKTRVITTKIAYLIGEKKVNPYSILAVTFTKKAANEMHERAVALEPLASEAQIRTFHSFGAWFLRVYAEYAGVDPNFTVYDDEDVVSLIQKVEPKLTKKEAAQYARKIALAKDYCLKPDSPELLTKEAFLNPSDFPQMYEAYEKRLRATGNVDFGDLILLPYLALEENAALREKMYRRFRVIMVDEYQDSNVAQFKLLEALSGFNEGSGTYVCVVGDDDQSIYKFRGAEIQNILNFPKIFDGTKIVRLESNYRSTQEILSLADNVIKNNSGRLGKTLRAERGSGKTPVLAFLPNQDDEVHFCADLIQKTHSMGTPYSDWAILYRTNAQSMGFESEFVRKKIPYIIVGSLKFFEREEVKDLIAWLELVANHKNEIAFQRIINKPARGIGNKTQDAIVLASQTEYQLIEENGEIRQKFEANDIIAACRYKMPSLSAKVRGELSKFIEIFDEIENLFGEDVSAGGELAEQVVSGEIDSSGASLSQDGENNLPQNSSVASVRNSSDELKKRESRKTLAELIEIIAKKSGLASYYEERDKDEHTFRVENIQELANSAVPYPLARQGLLDFLDNIQLDRTLSNADEDIAEDAVTLITLHNTKGLEFNRVVMTGMEEGVFPRNGDDEEEMEEERRLCYVGITRAKNELYLTSCAVRRMYGHIEYMKCSPFLLEMGREGVKAIGQLPSRYRGSGFHGGDYGERGLSHPDVEADPIKRKYCRGAKIYHDDYGYGIIMNTQTNDEGEYAITVSFENGGVKRFLPKYQESSLMIVKD
ncbi:MAG: UvrD-helicase domain-containing protein [Treponema sp.]|uniref:ATP-dependent helicase n=1 Tax=Treponema sp. TaxID=166 RepID=UPI0025DFB620|nr:ATP-dependent helicase [Treponema sp.]MBR0496395.1 UvrD-helicase domain-containing protein [Treponema sp.]